MKLIQRLPVNETGIDYICGDLHGMYDQLITLLAHIEFRVNQDRLILVGDLVDRGPKPVECLRLLTKPWVYSVMGNHEEMLLSTAFDSHPDITAYECDSADIIRNGGEWILPFIVAGGDKWVDHATAVYPDFMELLAHVISMPRIIVVGEDESRFNVMHTNAPRDWNDHRIDSLEEGDIASTSVIPGIDIPSLWARNIISNAPWNPAAGLSTTYIGHSITTRAQRFGSYINMDTGSSLGWKHRNEQVLDAGDDPRDRFQLSIMAHQTQVIHRCNVDHTCTSYAFE